MQNRLLCKAKIQPLGPVDLREVGLEEAGESGESVVELRATEHDARRQTGKWARVTSGG